MIVESGHFALIMAFCVACVQASLPFYGVYKGHERLMSLADSAAKVQFILLLWSFIALTIAFVTSDFSVALVAHNSHAAKPLIYKFAGVWGNHEGSMLLWILILAAYGAAVAWLGHKLPAPLKARALGVQGFLGVCFLAFSLFTSNPFERLVIASFEGNGLNPILQDLALAAHPPLLYAGYVGFSMAFSFSIAVLLGGEIDRSWARWVRPWTLLAWIALTLGIALGSFWAYYELGWGGFWFWDPVENASLMPWLAGTALLHSALVAERRDMMRRWTILLSILTFGLSIMGTFLVRSGVLTSVHTFANDPERGVFVLWILAITVGGALVLYASRANEIAQLNPKPFELISREGALMANNIFLASATATVFVGTLYPLAIDALGMGKLSVGAPYYNAVFTPLMIPLILLIPFGPLLGWGVGRGQHAVKQLQSALVLSVLFAGTVVLMRGGFQATDSYQAGAVLGLAGAAWLVCGAFADIARKSQIGRRSPKRNLQLLLRLPGQIWGPALAHAGVGVMLFGVIGTTAWKAEEITTMQAGDKIEIAGYQLQLKKVQNVNGPNYRAEQGVFLINKNGETYKLFPERRFYDVERSQTTEAAILKHLSAHLYIALGDRLVNVNDQESNQNEYIVRAWVHPFVAFIWIGALVMSLGGVASLISRWRRGDLSGQAERVMGGI